MQLEDAPEGMACEDIDGKLIEIGDTVKITIGASERTFIVSMISYFGFEDRSQAEVWTEPGCWMIVKAPAMCTHLNAA